MRSTTSVVGPSRRFRHLRYFRFGWERTLVNRMPDECKITTTQISTRGRTHWVSRYITVLCPRIVPTLRRHPQRSRRHPQARKRTPRRSRATHALYQVIGAGIRLPPHSLSMFEAVEARKYIAALLFRSLIRVAATKSGHGDSAMDSLGVHARRQHGIAHDDQHELRVSQRHCRPALLIENGLRLHAGWSKSFQQ